MTFSLTSGQKTNTALEFIKINCDLFSGEDHHKTQSAMAHV